MDSFSDVLASDASSTSAAASDGNRLCAPATNAPPATAWLVSCLSGLTAYSSHPARRNRPSATGKGTYPCEDRRDAPSPDVPSPFRASAAYAPPLRLRTTAPAAAALRADRRTKLPPRRVVSGPRPGPGPPTMACSRPTNAPNPPDTATAVSQTASPRMIGDDGRDHAAEASGDGAVSPRTR